MIYLSKVLSIETSGQEYTPQFSIHTYLAITLFFIKVYWQTEITLADKRTIYWRLYTATLGTTTAQLKMELQPAPTER